MSTTEVDLRWTFDYESRGLQSLLYAYCDESQADDWLFYLAAIGQSSDQPFAEVQEALIVGGVAAGNYTLHPWNVGDVFYSGSTAHKCAGKFIHDTYREIFNQADVPARAAEIDPWIAKRRKSAVARMKRQATIANYSELHSLAESLERERLLVLPKLGGGNIQQVFATRGEYFAAQYNFGNGKTDAQIRDRWQEMTDDQRKAICPDDWLKLDTDKTTKAGAQRLTILARQVKSLRQTAEKNLAKSRGG